MDRLKEATYFLQQMLMNYHEPDAFRFSLNAFLQAARNVTFVMQAELSKDHTFQVWYPSKREEMRKVILLRSFVEARNIVVKRKGLEAISVATVALFRGYTVKLGTSREVSPHLASKTLLKHAQSFFIGFLLDKEHSAVGEQLGVMREWKCPELGEEEVVTACTRVLDHLGLLLCDLGNAIGCSFTWIPGKVAGPLKAVQTILETDIDPTLPEKWGWTPRPKERAAARRARKKEPR